jgi:hypothetical protein
MYALRGGMAHMSLGLNAEEGLEEGSIGLRMVLVVWWEIGVVLVRKIQLVWCVVVWFWEVYVCGRRGVFYTMIEGIVQQWRERRDWRALRDNGEWGAL